jgi:serine protease Do
MSVDNKVWITAEAYLAKNLSTDELGLLEIKIGEDKNFASEFHDACSLLRSLNNAGSQQKFKNNLATINQKIKEESAVKPRKIALSMQYLRTAGVAAVVAILASVGSMWVMEHNSHNNTSKYSELRKEIRSDLENIKQSQSRIIKDLNNKANKPQIENKYSGTGFALSNDGYLVTNYHVTKGADSLYIQTRDGNYYKAYTVSFDATADIAILKIQAKNFKFSKNAQIPYSFANTKSGLGTQVYTLGYPQNDAVYSEGYISSRNGYLGDSLQYRLELPADPGQSGAPVLDASGNIVAIVTAKESKSVGTTFAVSTKAMLKLLRGIPESVNIRLPKSSKLTNLSRNQQIEKIQDFTCVVKVYGN